MRRSVTSVCRLRAVFVSVGVVGASGRRRSVNGCTRWVEVILRGLAPGCGPWKCTTGGFVGCGRLAPGCAPCRWADRPARRAPVGGGHARPAARRWDLLSDDPTQIERRTAPRDSSRGVCRGSSRARSARPRARCRSRLRPASAASHQSAAGLWDFAQRPRGPVEVVREGSHGLGPAGVRVHETTSLPLSEIRHRYGVRVTSPARPCSTSPPRSMPPSSNGPLAKHRPEAWCETASSRRWRAPDDGAAWRWARSSRTLRR